MSRCRQALAQASLRASQRLPRSLRTASWCARGEPCACAACAEVLQQRGGRAVLALQTDTCCTRLRASLRSGLRTEARRCSATSEHTCPISRKQTGWMQIEFPFQQRPKAAAQVWHIYTACTQTLVPWRDRKVSGAVTSNTAMRARHTHTPTNPAGGAAEAAALLRPAGGQLEPCAALPDVGPRPGACHTLLATQQRPETCRTLCITSVWWGANA